MKPRTIFLLGSLMGGTAVAIIAAVICNRKIEENARELYIDGYNDGHEVGTKGEPNPWL
jgi:hypothetical protein